MKSCCCCYKGCKTKENLTIKITSQRIYMDSPTRQGKGKLSIKHVLTEISALQDLNVEYDHSFQIRNNITFNSNKLFLDHQPIRRTDGHEPIA